MRAKSVTIATRAVATGVYRYIYPPPQKKISLPYFFMWLFCLLDPGQIRVNIYTHPNQIPGYAPDSKLIGKILFTVSAGKNKCKLINRNYLYSSVSFV